MDKADFSKKYVPSENGKIFYQPPYNETGSFGNSKKDFFNVSGTTNAKIYSDIKRVIHNPTLANKTLISMGYVPDIYVALNLIKDKYLNANRATFRKAYGLLSPAEIASGLTQHNVPDNVIKQIGSLIADPLLIIKSQSTPGRIVAVITDCIFDKNHKLISDPIIVAISPSANGKGYTLIPSIHERKKVIKMISTAESRNEIYYIKNKKIALNRIAYGKNTQPPSMLTGLSYQSTLLSNSIPSKEDIVKRFGLSDENGTTFYQSAKQGEAGDPFAYPYPVGREREAIFRAFDNVFSKLKWETTEQGTRLYQPMNAIDEDKQKWGPSIKEFFSPIYEISKEDTVREMHRVHDTPTISILNDKSQLISLGNVPDILASVGVDNATLYTNKLALRKALGELTQDEIKNNPKLDLHNHHLTWDILEDLPDLIADPVAIYKDKGDYVVVLDRTVNVNGKNIIVMAVVSTVKNRNGYAIIPTVYERGNILDKLKEAKKENRLKYFNAKMGALSIHAHASHRLLIKHLSNSIPSKEDIVKRYGLTDDSSQALHQSAKSNLPETIEIDGEKKSTRNSEGGFVV